MGAEGVDMHGRRANHTMNQNSAGAVSGSGNTKLTSSATSNTSVSGNFRGGGNLATLLSGSGRTTSGAVQAGAGTVATKTSRSEHRPRLLLRSGADWGKIFGSGAVAGSGAGGDPTVDPTATAGAPGIAGPMDPLARAKGVIFPYPPMMNFQHQTTYGRIAPTHSNFVYPYFTNHSLGGFTVQASFTIATQAEHAYYLACHHFIKTCMKMHYGENDKFAGVPPIVLEFSAYGPQIVHKLPVVIEMYNYITDPNYDYVFGGEPTDSFSEDDTAVPIKMDMILQLLPAYNPKTVRKEFSLTDFASGSILKKGYI